MIASLVRFVCPGHHLLHAVGGKGSSGVTIDVNHNVVADIWNPKHVSSEILKQEQSRVFLHISFASLGFLLLPFKFKLLSACMFVLPHTEKLAGKSL